MRSAGIAIPFSTRYTYKPMLSIALSASFADLDLDLVLALALDLNLDLAKNPRLCVSVSAGQACGNKRPWADSKRGHGSRVSIIRYEYLRVFSGNNAACDDERQRPPALTCARYHDRKAYLLI